MSKLIGRGVVMDRISNRVLQLESGTGSFVLLRGSVGIGKARVVTEVLTSAAAGGTQVARGAAQPFDGDSPYSSVARVLGSFDNVVVGHPFAEIRAMLDQEACERGSPRRASQSNWNHELLSAAARFKTESRFNGSTVLAFEELHFADLESLALIATLIRGLLHQPVLVLASMVGKPGRPRTNAEAELEHLANSCGEIQTLQELGRAELRELLVQSCLVQVDEQLVDTIDKLAGGNPLLAETAIRSCAAKSEDEQLTRRSDPLPPVNANDVERLQTRLFAGDPDQRGVAQVVSAFRCFSLDYLDIVADLSAQPEDRVAAAFDRLVANGLLVAVGGSRFDFQHPIVRSTCYADMGPANRRRVHAAVVDRLLAKPDENSPLWLNEMATHVAALANPGDLGAASVLIRAAKSSSADDPAAAARWYDRALDLLPAGSPQQAEIRAVQARELWAASSPMEAAEVGRLAVHEMEPGDRRTAIASLVANSLYAAGLLEEAIDFIESQLERGTHECPLAAQAAHFLGLVGRVQEADSIYAAMTSRISGSTAAQTTALGHLAHYARLRGRRSDIQLLLERLRRLIDADSSRLAAGHEFIALLQTGPGFIRDAEASLATITAARAGGEIAGGCQYACALAQTQWLRGDWDGAFETAVLAIKQFEVRGLRVNIAYLKSLAISILVHRGALGQAQQRLEAIGWAPEAHRPVISWASALVYHAMGDSERAIKELALAREFTESGIGFWRHLVLSQLAELQIDRRDPLASETVADLVALAEAEGDPWVQHLACRSNALLRSDAIDAHEALSIAQREGMEFEVAQSRFVLGRLGVDPEVNLRAAFEGFDRLQADPWRRSTARVMRGLGLGVGRKRRDRAGVLTEPEARIASLVQEGLTNRQIATGLHYSVKTIEAYLTRIYTKTGCDSRLGLARAMDTGRIRTIELV